MRASIIWGVIFLLRLAVEIIAFFVMTLILIRRGAGCPGLHG